MDMLSVRKNLSEFMLSLEAGTVDVSLSSCLLTELLLDINMLNIEAQKSLLGITKDILHASYIKSQSDFHESQPYFAGNSKPLNVPPLSLCGYVDSLSRKTATYESMLDVYDKIVDFAYECRTEDDFSGFLRSCSFPLRNYEVLLRDNLLYQYRNSQHETICAFAYKWELMKL